MSSPCYKRGSKYRLVWCGPRNDPRSMDVYFSLFYRVRKTIWSSDRPALVHRSLVVGFHVLSSQFLTFSLWIFLSKLALSKMTHFFNQCPEKSPHLLYCQLTEKIKWVISSDLRENKEKMILVRKWNMKNVILIFYLAQADILEQINKNVIQPVSKVQSDSRYMQLNTWVSIVSLYHEFPEFKSSQFRLEIDVNLKKWYV